MTMPCYAPYGKVHTLHFLTTPILHPDLCYPRGNLFDFLVSRGGRLEEPEAAAVVIRPLMAAVRGA